MCFTASSLEPSILRCQTRTAIFASTASHSFNVKSVEPERTRPPESAATHWTCDAATQRVAP